MRILVVAYGGGHARMLLPVIRKLSADGLDVTVLGLTTGLDYFKKHAISAFSISDFATKFCDWSKIKNIGASITDGIQKSAVVSDIDTIAYYGLGYRDLLRELPITEAETRFQTLGRKSFLPVQAANKILNMVKPDLLVTTNSPRFERAFVTAAGKNSIKALVLVESVASNELSWLKQPNYGDKICVFHEVVKKNLIELGRPDSHIVVTGNPAFYSPTLEARSPKKNREKPRLIYLSQTEFDDSALAGNKKHNTNVVDITLSELARIATNGEADVCVRFHPHQDLDQIQVPSSLRISKNSVELDHELVHVDAVLTASSSAALQAISYDIPILQIGWSNRSDMFRFSDFGPSQFVREPAEIVNCLRNLMSQSNYGASSFPDHRMCTATICGLVELLADGT